MDYAQDRKYPEVMADARRRGILVNAVQAGGARDTERVWRQIAQMGGGRYLRIPQDGGQVSQAPTPFDDEIIRLQIEINGTVVPYGSRAEQDSVAQRQSQVAAAPAATGSDLAGYVRRASRGRDAITGAGDLVSDVLRNGVALDSVPAPQLPPALHSLTPEQRLQHLREQDERRRSLSTRMEALIAQRDAHRRTQQAAAPREAAFDRVVSEALAAQIRR
jgi:hypothetical protein